MTAKFRCYDTVEKTVEYAKMLERAGAQMLTCHGRTREMKGHLTVRAPLCLNASVAASTSSDHGLTGSGGLGED